MSRAWIAFYMGDYQKDTNSLTTLEHGAYFLLLNECWQHGKIPMEPAKRAAVAKMTLKEWKKVAPSIDPFFNDDGTNKRASREIDKAEQIRLKRAIAGQRGGTNSGISKAIAKGRDSKYQANADQPFRQSGLQTSSPAKPILNSIDKSSLISPRDSAVETPQTAATNHLLESLERIRASKKAPKPAEPQQQPEEARVWVDEGSIEWSAHTHYAQSRGIRPRLPIELTVDGVTKRGAHFDSLVPSGYDEQTGERIPPANSEVSAA